VKRPAPGVVFDRFYDAWLDSGTQEDQEAWLVKGTAAPNAAAGRMILALFYSRQNDHPRAVGVFEEALQLIPDNATAWHLKALAESRTLGYTAALASIEKGLALPPATAIRTTLLQLKGRLLARSEKPDEALKVRQQLVDASPDDIALQEDLIEFQLTKGLDSAALATAEKLLATTTDPYQKVQHRPRVGDLHARSGNREAAIAAYAACFDDTGTNSWLEKDILSQLEQTCCLMEAPGVARYPTPAWPAIPVFFRQFEAARRLLKQESYNYFQTYHSSGTLAAITKPGCTKRCRISSRPSPTSTNATVRR